MQFEETLRRKDPARANKLENYIQTGKSGINLGVRQANRVKTGHEFGTWGSPLIGGAADPQELNSTHTAMGHMGRPRANGKGNRGRFRGKKVDMARTFPDCPTNKLI